MNKLYVCVKCGLVSEDKAKCPDCKRHLVAMSADCVSTVQEKVVIPGIGMSKVVYSVEAVQDLKIAQVAIGRYRASEPTEEEIRLWETLSERHAFGYIRTPDPTEEEVREWKHYNKLFAKLDHEAVKKRYNVHILREEEPYEYMGEDSWDIGSKYRQ